MTGTKKTTPAKASEGVADNSPEIMATDPIMDMMERLAERMDKMDAREAELDAREASVAPREREEVTTSMSRKTDDSKYLERLAIDHYSPPNQLEVPTDHEYHYRWVAEWVNGSQTPRGVNERLREGYVRVMAQDLPEDFLVDEDTFRDGYARTTGLILMRITHERKSLRDKYYANLSRERLGSANELQGVAGRDSVKEDRGSRSLSGAEAGRALQQMSNS